MGTQVASSGLTPQQRALVLESLRQGWSITKAARVARCSVEQIFAEQKNDKDFAGALVAAYETGTDSMEDEVARRAFRGVTKAVRHAGVVVGFEQEYSDGLARFMLMARRPKKFQRYEDDPRDKPPEGDGEDVIALIEEELARIAARQAALIEAEEDNPKLRDSMDEQRTREKIEAALMRGHEED